jgi:hypothetical protein
VVIGYFPERKKDGSRGRSPHLNPFEPKRLVGIARLDEIGPIYESRGHRSVVVVNLQRRFDSIGTQRIAALRDGKFAPKNDGDGYRYCKRHDGKVLIAKLAPASLKGS